MTIRFLCPSGHHLSVPDSSAGTKVRCARCKKIVRVPPASSEEKPPVRKAAAPRAEAKPKPAASKADGKAESAGPKKRLSRRKTARERRLLQRPLKQPTSSTDPKAEEKPPKPSAERPKQSKTRPSPALMPSDVYLPDRGKVASVKWLALILAGAVAFSTGPVFYQGLLNLETAPGWARLVLLLAAVQAVFVVWMLNRPDWASVWVVMLVFAVASALYGMASAIAIMWPDGDLMPLGLEPIRRSARAWCGAVLLTTSLATYLCGRTSAKWRRQFELETAGKSELRR